MKKVVIDKRKSCSNTFEESKLDSKMTALQTIFVRSKQQDGERTGRIQQQQDDDLDDDDGGKSETVRCDGWWCF